MSLYYLKEYLKYRLRAKDLHGVHSPFVYAFNEQALHNAGKGMAGEALVLGTAVHKKLVNRIIAYFGYQDIFWITDPQGAHDTSLGVVRGEDGHTRLWSKPLSYAAAAQHPPADLLLVQLPDPQDWVPAIARYRSWLKEDSSILVMSIHESDRHSKAWELLAADAATPLSIDIFRVGLLISKKEFLDKQHFVLKYSG